MSLSKKDSLRIRLVRKLLRWSAHSETLSGRNFTTLHKRPKRNDQIGTWPEPDFQTSGCALVMQGPLAHQDDFTLETLRLYRRHMPDAELILSTWKDEDQSTLAQIADLGVTIVKNDKPDVPGLSNMNMQIVSAKAGMKHAVASGAKWIMKTRTDQRFYEPNLFPFLIGLVESLPLKIEGKQNRRIVGLGQGSLKFVPYHVTDQTLFGEARDMLAYWSPPLQGSDAAERWKETRKQVYIGYNIGDLIRETVPECYLASNFLVQMGHSPAWTVPDSWSVYRDRFCFVDYGTSDFYWIKGQSHTLSEYNKTYEHISNRQEMSFLEWHLMYSAQLKAESGERYDDVLKSRFTGLVTPPSQ